MPDNLHLIGLNVIHKKYKEGKIVKFNDKNIWIEFASGEKQFSFPDVFEVFLKCTDNKTQEQLMELIEEKKQKEELERHAVIENFVKSRERVDPELNSRPRKTRKVQKENVVFKCNYCDGGQNEERIGFYAPCSDELIRYNIEDAGHSWCCSEESPCCQYYDGLLDRKELDQMCENDGYVCYESQMLRNWTALAGYVLKGDQKNKPMKMNKVQVNSLAVFTSREPGEPERDRFIFGVFLVDEVYQGDDYEEGYVKTKSKYKISLSRDEAHKMLFWNYYRNEKDPENIRWGQGLHRYLSDEQAVNILKDIVEIKAGTTDEYLAKDFLDYFCSVNALDQNEISPKSGTLVLRKNK